jgi:hypothetical protein
LIRNAVAMPASTAPAATRPKMRASFAGVMPAAYTTVLPPRQLKHLREVKLVDEGAVVADQY